jgi:integrase
MTTFDFGAEGRKENHEEFYSLPGISAWRDELALRSRLTADDYVRRVALFSSVTGLSPAEIVRKAKDHPEKFRSLLSEYAVAQQHRGRRAVYVRKHFDALRSWLGKNGVRDVDVPKLSGRRNETIENERTPSQDELRILLGALSSRGRVVALLMAHSGLRPGAIANIDGTDGLLLRDLPELTLSPEPKFEKVPFQIRVRSARSKNAKSYVTFGSAELAEAILVLLRDRLSRGETLSSDRPLVASLGAGVGKGGAKSKGPGGYVTTKSITMDLREAIQRVRPGGETFRPYTLRSFFSTQMLIAESKGLIVRDAREEMMGHDLGVSGRYNLSKKLGEHVLEELRAMYDRSILYLSTTPGVSTSNEELFQMILGGAGYDEVAIRALGTLTADKVRDAIRKKQESDGRASGPVQPGQQKVVDATAVEAWIEKGWRFVAPLNGSKAVIEAPKD